MASSSVEIGLSRQTCMPLPQRTTTYSCSLSCRLRQPVVREACIPGSLSLPAHFQGTISSGKSSRQFLNIVRAAASGSSQSAEGNLDNLTVGDAIVIVEQPEFLKSAEPMPMLRPGSLVKVGEAGRVIDRRPKNMWAVRFKNGAFLIDSKYIKPLKKK